MDFMPGMHNKTDRIVIGWDGMDWIILAQDRDQWRSFLNMITELGVA
jgi:hypothetical protein